MQLQHTDSHKERLAVITVKNGLKPLKNRDQFRSLNLTLNTELAKLYFDKELNSCFCGEYFVNPTLMLAVHSHRENLRQGESKNLDSNSRLVSDALV